jgi:hypothetical protein
MESEKVSVYADITIALPMLATALDTTAREVAAKRKRPEFDPSKRVLVMNGHPLPEAHYQEP